MLLMQIVHTLKQQEQLFLPPRNAGQQDIREISKLLIYQTILYTTSYKQQ